MITVITEDDRTFPIDVDASIELENLKALLEVDSNIPADQQQLLYGGKPLNDVKATLASCGVNNDDLLILKDRRHAWSTSTTSAAGPSSRSSGGKAALPATASEQQAAEELRQRILADPAALSMLRTNNPQLAQAVSSSPAHFLQLLRAQRDAMERSGAAAEAAATGASGLDGIVDEFDIDAQRRIEENIRQQRVMENLEHAMEYSPESFGRVTMLYVDCKVNGTHVKAFVDSGAQATIMSPECAERCGIMRLIDTRFAGIARGVGTAKILGRVHSTQLQLGNGLFLPCSFTIMEGKGVDMLFGLDMLKRYQATIDLGKNALVINGEQIRFLDEHELPSEASAEYEVDQEGTVKVKEGAGPLGAASANANAAAAAAASVATVAPKFPGSGQAVGASSGADASSEHFASHGWSFSHPTTTASGTPPATAAPAPSSQWPAASIKALTDLGASSTQARSLLDAAEGNVEVAASLLFQQ